MPMPKPKPGEAEKDFVSRFMADQAMGVEFPDEKQRAAVAHQTFRDARKGGKDIDTDSMTTVESILESLQLRQLASRWGIGTALQYVKCVDAVFAAGLTNPTLAFDLAPSVWAKELESAARRLTYCDEGSGDIDFIVKSVRDGAGIARGAVLEYDCILSTKRKDRDGDIVEPGGMDVDVKMPLLWQHVQSQPIGRHVSVVKQDENVVVCKFAIADIPLGRDAATLVKFGALRKSHGFKPVPGEFEPLEIVKQADGKQVAKGWHIRKSTVMEGSLVSIPANADANVLAVYEKEFDGLCTAFSRSELKTDAVKHWAKAWYDRRPVTVAGADVQQKGVYDVLESAEFPGSFEWTREKLGLAVQSRWGLSPRQWSYVAATFPDRVIVCVSRRPDVVDLGSPPPQDIRSCYSIAWKAGDNGEPELSGEPKEITVSPQILEKLMSDLQTKAGGQMGTQVVTSGNPAQAAAQGAASSGQPLHSPQKKRCPKCGRADLDSTNTCPDCGYIDHTNTTKPDTQPASSADENPGGGTKPITGTLPTGKPAGGGKAADAGDIATKCGDAGGGAGEGKGKKRACKCGSPMGEDGKCPKCGGSEYAKAYDLGKFSADELGRLLAAKAVSGDRAAVLALKQASAVSAVVTAERDPLAELFEE